MAHYDTYRDQLASLYHGHALWVPDPAGLYDRVQVGDVGYVKQGQFLRMFNALLPADDSTQVYGVPEGYVPLNMGPFNNIRTLNLSHPVDYCSNTWSRMKLRVLHSDAEETGAAFLTLPFNADSVDAIRTKPFETYIHKHCDSWLEFAIINNLDVRLEDIILVTGCDLTSSWAMAAFVNSWDSEIKLSVASQSGSARGFRAKRILGFKTLKAAAESRPDDTDNELESSIELLREPTILDYRDPLIGILDYIAKQHPDQELALAHEDDLKMIEGVDVLTADAVEDFLRQNKSPVQSDGGVALLADEGEEGIPEEAKVTFHVQASIGDEVLPLVVHPTLMKYLLKFDISQPPDHDFGLPTEEYLSSAVHPPVHASDKGSGVGVTVGDVLKAIGADLRKPFSQREWAALNEDIRSQVEYAFLHRAQTEDAKIGGFLRIDHLRGRNRLQVFPRHPYPEEDEEIAQPLVPLHHPIGVLEGAGPSSAPLRAPYRGIERAV
ncbi:hypothetical protein EDB87DRAFT_1578956 [Lactarius vividus]|nr:hypothetical protein EDB87DRAFT_1578956 [Lactarius vividus]